MKKLLLITISLFLIGLTAGCSKSGSNTLSGQFIDSNVAGLSYETSSGFKGITDEQGRYNYKPGDRVTFMLGNITIGTCDASDYVTPVDIFPGNSEAALNLAQFLQSIDSDGNPDNGITPSEEAVEILSNVRRFDFERPSFDSVLRDNLPPQLHFVDESEAQNHMDESFAVLGIKPSSKYEQVFVGGDNQNGFEIWKTDGTIENSALVKDLDPVSTQASQPNNYVLFEEKVLFQANDGVHGSELWISDGSESGTLMLKDINEGTAESRPIHFTVIGDTCFFQAANDANGSELWKTDGTQEGTVLVKDIRAGTQDSDLGGKEAPSRAKGFDSQTVGLGSNPQYLVNLNGTLVFTANDGINGTELWKSDGTPEGTTLIKDITEGTSGFNPTNLNVIGTTLYFTSSQSGTQLYKTDGTSEGTVIVEDFGTSYIYQMTAMNNTLYFFLSAQSPGSTSMFYKSDGTSEGTIKIKTLVEGYTGDRAYRLTATANKLYFSYREAFNIYNEVLWVSDGTADGTQVLKTTNDETIVPQSNFTILGDTIYFSASSSSNTYGTELWKSNGTASGTLLVKDIYVDGTSGSYPNYIHSVGSNIYFRANDGTQTAVWITDGTTEGTTLLQTMNYSYPDSYIGLNGKVLFSLDSGKIGDELWISDATPSGTMLLKDINQVSTSSLELDAEILKVGDKHYFVKYNNNDNPELWVTDSTEEGTVSLGIYNDIYLSRSTILNDKLVLFVGDGDDYILKITDGTVDGTTDIETYDDADTYLVAVGNQLFYVAYDSSEGDTLHVSDGTQNGASVFRGPNNDTYTDARYLTVAGDKLFFSYYVNNTGKYRMHATDGTAAGTTILLDINSSVYFSDFAGTDENLYFRAYENDVNSSLNHGEELWISDGTAEGTHILKNIANDENGEESSYPDNMVNVNGTLYFTANDQIHGQELWRSDGTEAGTVLVKDIREGGNSSSPRLRASIGNKLYFSTSSEECCGSDILWTTNIDTNITEEIDLNITERFNMRSVSSSKDSYLPTYEGYWLLWLDVYDADNHKILKKVIGNTVETFQDVTIGTSSGGPI